MGIDVVRDLTEVAPFRDLRYGLIVSLDVHRRPRWIGFAVSLVAVEHSVDLGR